MRMFKCVGSKNLKLHRIKNTIKHYKILNRVGMTLQALSTTMLFKWNLCVRLNNLL